MNATTIEVMSLGKGLRSEGSMSEKEGIEPSSRVNNDKEEAVPPPSFSPLPAMDQKLPVPDVGTAPAETLQAAPSAEAAQSLPVNKSVAPFGVPLKCRSAKPCSLDPLRLSDISTCVQELNKRYAVVKWGGKVLVIDELDDTVQPLKPTDFFNLYNNIRVQGTGNTTSPLGSYWFNSPLRRQYLDGVVFDPSGSHPRGVYNLWQGFGVHPMSGASCALFHAHLLQVICAGCVKCYQYVLNWLALMIQQPHELPGVAIVLVSIEGTGKGLFIKYLQALMGVHFVRVSHKSELVGQFSGHLSRAVLVFADELCWRDDRDAAGVLKGLITEKTRLLNQKHIDAIPVNNCIHLIAASNESWVIPAGQTDRRFLVLDVVPCLASTILSGRRQL